MQHLFQVAHDLRWVLVVLVGLTMGALFAAVVGERNAAEKRADRLQVKVHRLELKLSRYENPTAPADRPGRAQILALKPRQEPRRG